MPPIALLQQRWTDDEESRCDPGVDADAAHLSGRPPVWQVLKEQGIDLEIRDARRLLRRRAAFDDDERCAGLQQQDQSARDLEDLPQHGVHRATIPRGSAQVKASAAFLTNMSG